MSGWYYIKLNSRDNALLTYFYGYFYVNNSIITQLYESINGTVDFSTNILGPSSTYTSGGYTLQTANNVFDINTLTFSDMYDSMGDNIGGTIITSNNLQSILGSQSNKYLIYGEVSVGLQGGG